MCYRDVVKVLRKNGWVLTRTVGSHCQFQHTSSGRMVTVPKHKNADIPKGTLHAIEKSTGLHLL